MPTIEFLSDGKVIAIEEGESMLQASLRAGIPHTHVCGGKARCTTCRVLLIDGDENKLSPRNDQESALADKFGFASNIRLACQAYVSDDIKTRRLVIDDDDVDLTLMLMSDDTIKVSSTGTVTGVPIDPSALSSIARAGIAASPQSQPHSTSFSLNWSACISQ